MHQTQQITVRLPTDLVEWLDAQIPEDRSRSRATLVARALRKARQEQQTERDLQIMLAAAPDPDEESRLKWMRTRQYPDMGEAPGPAAGLVLDNAQIRQVNSVAADHPEATGAMADPVAAPIIEDVARVLGVTTAAAAQVFDALSEVWRSHGFDFAPTLVTTSRTKTENPENQSATAHNS